MAVIAAIVVVGLLYVLAWNRLRQDKNRRNVVGWEHLVAFLAGLLAIGLALLSPLDALSDRFFFAHMLQHEAFMFIIPPLLLPGLLPFIGIEQIPIPGYRRLQHLASPLAIFCLSTIILWLWHIPPVYNFALSHEPVHDLEHLTLLGGFLLYWWPLAASNQSLASNGARVLYILAGATQAALLGGLITFADRVVYTHYLVTPHPDWLSPLEDQQLGGAMMLFPGAFVYGIAALLTVRNHRIPIANDRA